MSLRHLVSQLGLLQRLRSYFPELPPLAPLPLPAPATHSSPSSRTHALPHTQDHEQPPPLPPPKPDPRTMSEAKKRRLDSASSVGSIGSPIKESNPKVALITGITGQVCGGGGGGTIPVASLSFK